MASCHWPFCSPATDFPLFRSLLNVCLYWLIDLLLCGKLMFPENVLSMWMCFKHVNVLQSMWKLCCVTRWSPRISTSSFFYGVVKPIVGYLSSLLYHIMWWKCNLQTAAPTGKWIVPTLFPGSLLFSFIPGAGRKRDPGTEVEIELVLACCSKTDIMHNRPFWLLWFFHCRPRDATPENSLENITWSDWENKTYKLKGLL